MLLSGILRQVDGAVVTGAAFRCFAESALMTFGLYGKSHKKAKGTRKDACRKMPVAVIL
mgnify:FL=1